MTSADVVSIFDGIIDAVVDRIQEQIADYNEKCKELPQRAVKVSDTGSDMNELTYQADSIRGWTKQEQICCQGPEAKL